MTNTQAPLYVVMCPQLEGVHGIARYVRSFLANYPEDAPPVLVLAGPEGPTVPAPANVTIDYIPIPANRFGLLSWALATRKRLKALAREGRLALINIHMPPLIPFLLLPRVAPIMVTGHTTYLGMSGQFYDPPQFESQWSNSSITVKKAMERFIFNRAEAILALTEQGRQEVMRYDFKGSVDILPNGVDIALFQPSEAPDKTIDVIFVGRIERRKGSRPMVDAVKALVAQRPSIRIAIVGYGDDDAYVQEQLAPLAPAVHLAGKVSFDKVSRMYDAAHVYASTSYYEGLPGTCIEAMAMRLPAVAWDFPFYEGLVREGETGHRVAPNDIGTFTSRVLNLLDHPEQAATMGRAGRAVAESDYDWKRLGRRIADTMARLARPGRM
ncbi:glycosyltransferase family 4 protein [Novosphingobium rosa]|uniref:glycosyltransferase family 4 protein n=1 Tax=Novosphingobium rosa TaxID=76978 RepID=UPI000835DBC7|nr:glycosyltransferase family 4 protein [Novosphingobium rosa]